MAILVFDGSCAMCSRGASFVLRHAGDIGVVPGRSDEGKDVLAAGGRTGWEERSLVLILGKRSYVRSAAVVRILWRFGGAWRALAALLWLVPWPLRDVGYRVVARMRHRAR